MGDLEPEPLTANVVHSGGNVLVALQGELDLHTASVLLDAVAPLLAGTASEIVIEASGLSFVDSSGLAALVAIQNRLNERARRLVLRSVRPSTRKTLEMTNLADFLNVEPESPAE